MIEPSNDCAYVTRDDLPASLGDNGAQIPGVFPFLRGIHRDMYVTRPWRMRQYAGFGTPLDTNVRWKSLIDLPTQVGLDSDDPRVGADAGRLGVAIDTLDDFRQMFEGIPLDRTAATFNVTCEPSGNEPPRGCIVICGS